MGIEVEVVDPRTLKPLDTETITQSVTKTGRAIIVHEAPTTGGFGAEVSARITEGESFFYLEAPVRRLAGMDVPIPYNRELERGVVPQEEDIMEAVREIVSV